MLHVEDKVHVVCAFMRIFCLPLRMRLCVGGAQAFTCQV